MKNTMKRKEKRIRKILRREIEVSQKIETAISKDPVIQAAKDIWLRIHQYIDGDLKSVIDVVKDQRIAQIENRIRAGKRGPRC